MKSNRKLIALIVTLVVIVNFPVLSSFSVFAHQTMLNVNYDNCTASEKSDGIDEMWYVLEKDEVCRHISHEVGTIRYRFRNDLDWVPMEELEEFGEEIKAAVAASIEKWNNVYFYSYNSDGTITKNQLINVVEVTEGECEITIRPDDGMESVGRTYPISEPVEIDGHYHYSNWEILINVDYFLEGFYSYITSDYVDWAKEHVGAHEFGHVLGLRDVDYINEYTNDDICNSEHGKEHHSELLMGYYEQDSQNLLNIAYSSPYITYKDIAGVAITRGFHTDEDHRWLTTGALYDGKYKLICSICNGVKYVENLTEYPHDMYAYCEGDHELSDGNMMAVASYGNKDYYKCKYCRYVAPFSEIINQNYTKTNFSAYLHKYVNNVENLEYTFYEAHQYTCVSASNLSHRSTCDCGETKIAAHYISGSHVGEDFVPCAGCGYLLDLRNNIYEGIMSITQVSINGSYILPNGIVVLVDEDIEAYLAGTLQFYHPEDVPVTQ